jgi:predicted nicotinamide N-methyase
VPQASTFAIVPDRPKARINHVEFGLSLADLTSGGAPAADLVMVADLLHDPETAARVVQSLDPCMEAGTLNRTVVQAKLRFFKEL